MNVFFTWDYELYFGSETGTAQSCMIEPTQALLSMSKKYNIPMTFFVDCGYLLRLKELKDTFSQVRDEYDAVCRQIEDMGKAGCEVQLHIHPHWEDSYFDGNRWIMNVNRYKLADFSKEEAAEIIRSYTQILREVSGQAVEAYRAGGWCVQPFSHISEALRVNGIRLDSSVFKGGYFQSDLYAYDFRDCPSAEQWKFEEDPCVAVDRGFFTELPISVYELSPFFFWKLFILGRLKPSEHKPIGNGKPVPSPGMRKKYLTRWNSHYVSGEGYFVTRLPSALHTPHIKNLTVLGHPKACTRFSLDYLDRFFARYHTRHTFRNVSDVLK
ncbi:MAG: hypothetical protein MH137_04795 [Flavobacteriales bacterium]|nr:hypothetical protein [Flavobacteriales bacterium]